MIAIVKLLIWSLVDFFKSRGRLEAEVVVLRHQLNILRRRSPKRVRPNALDRAIFVWLYRLFSGYRQCRRNHSAGDHRKMASYGFSCVVAVEVSKFRRPA